MYGCLDLGLIPYNDSRVSWVSSNHLRDLGFPFLSWRGLPRGMIQLLYHRSRGHLRIHHTLGSILLGYFDSFIVGEAT
jgi:hypothetical protein